MSNTQLRNFRRLKQLLRQLAGFGLNPYDWKIQRDSLLAENRIRMHHRSDLDFQFSGHISTNHEGQAYWQALRLASL